MGEGGLDMRQLTGGWGDHVAISSDGAWRAVSTHSRAFVWSPFADKPVSISLPGERAQSLAFDERSQSLFCGAYVVQLDDTKVTGPPIAPIGALARALEVSEAVVSLGVTAQSVDGALLLVSGQITPPRSLELAEPRDPFSVWCGVLDRTGRWLDQPIRLPLPDSPKDAARLPQGVAIAGKNHVWRWIHAEAGTRYDVSEFEEPVCSICAQDDDILILMSTGSLLRWSPDGAPQQIGQAPVPDPIILRSEGDEIWLATARAIMTLDGGARVSVSNDINDFAFCARTRQAIASLGPGGNEIITFELALVVK